MMKHSDSRSYRQDLQRSMPVVLMSLSSELLTWDTKFSSRCSAGIRRIHPGVVFSLKVPSESARQRG